MIWRSIKIASGINGWKDGVFMLGVGSGMISGQVAFVLLIAPNIRE